MIMVPWPSMARDRPVIGAAVHFCFHPLPKGHPTCSPADIREAALHQFRSRCCMLPLCATFVVARYHLHHGASLLEDRVLAQVGVLLGCAIMSISPKAWFAQLGERALAPAVDR